MILPLLIHTDQPVYQGTDLGLQYTVSATHFRIWSPPAAAVQLLLYRRDSDATANRVINLQKGVWYNVRVNIDGHWNQPVPAPYARAVGVNGRKAVIFDPRDTRLCQRQDSCRGIRQIRDRRLLSASAA
ncbi:MAG TPA: hypothetical protein VGM31_03475 [Puia sp.]|jgi:pullulanase